MQYLIQRSVRRLRGSGRIALVLSAVLVGALVTTVFVQTQASALSVFCVGADWSDGDGGTMADSGYPSPVPTTMRDDLWKAGSDGESRAVMGDLDSATHRIYSPQTDKKRECPADAAAPCVVTDVVTITAETWKVQEWEVRANPGGSIFGINVGISGGYGEEYGERHSETYTLSNMVPYGIGKTVMPSSFIDWKTRPGAIKGGYFKTGAVCRADGGSGQQYEFRDENIATFTAEENVGSGGTWIFEGSPLDEWL